jgi:hypothetical protein
MHYFEVNNIQWNYCGWMYLMSPTRILVAFDVCLLMMRQVSPSSVAKQRIILTELHPDLV